MQIMLVEDEYVLNKTITNYLSSKGHKVDSYYDGSEALSAISPDYDIFIIDIDLPHINGLELLEQVYKLYPTVPVIIISATIDISMITKAYKTGCKDYLKKPFDIKELELKINVFTTNNEEHIKLTEDLTYDKNTKELYFNEKAIQLTKKEHEFLLLLILNRGNVVPHEDIERSIWGIDCNKIYLRQLVNRLRNKIPEDIITTHVGEGYVIS